MEATIVVEENYQNGNANLNSKSVASSIRIESIIIDLVNTRNVIDVEKCKHFSIRGYVSKVRSNEWNKCWPFSVDSIDYNSEKQSELPPLDVPSFQWWSCQNCLRQVGTKGISNEAFRSKCNGSLENHKHGLVNVTHRRRSDMVKNKANVLNKVISSRRPFLELDECEYFSSENAEILLGAESGNSNRRKTRKVRLLKELLGKKGDERNILSAQISPIITPGEENTFSLREGLLTVPGNALGENRKRRLPEDGYCKFMEMSSANSACKKTKSFNKGKGIADAVRSFGLDGALIGADPETGAESHLANLKVVEGPTTGKKKKKTIQASGESLFLTSYQEHMQMETQKLAGDPSKKNAAFSVSFNFRNPPVAGSGLYPSRSAVEKTEKKSSLSERKNMIDQDCDGHQFPIPRNNSILKESLNSRQDLEIREMGSISAQAVSAQDIEKTLPSSFRNCLPTQLGEKKYNAPTIGGPTTLLPWQGDASKVNGITWKDFKTNHVGESRFSSRYDVDACLLHGVCFDLDSKRTFHKTSFPDEKLKRLSYQTEFGSSSLLQQTNYYSTSNEKSVASQKSMHIDITRKHSNHQAEMVFDKDEIPMGFVDLRAKNQYGRCLPNSESVKQSMVAANNGRNYEELDFDKACGSREIHLMQQVESAGKPNPLARNGWIGMSSKGNNMGSSKQRASAHYPQLDGNQYNMSQLEQTCTPTGFKLLARCSEKPSNSSPQNGQWIGNMSGNRSSALVACNGCHGAPQQKAAHLWPSTSPNPPHFPCNIVKKSADESTNKNTHSCRPSNLPRSYMNGGDDQNVLNPSISDLQSLGRKLDSETHKTPCIPTACKHNGVRSLNPCSNETIPAMHLLSLMDAGFQSGTQIDFNGNQRASFLHNHRSDVFPSMSSGGYRAVNSMKHPKSAFPEGKMKHSDSPVKIRNRKSQQTMPGGLSSTCPVHSMAKLILGAKNSTFPTQFQATKSGSKTQICSFNRNPADFTVPGAGNAYMIRGEDLKFRSSSPSWNRKGRNLDVPIPKEYSYNQTSRDFHSYKFW